MSCVGETVAAVPNVTIEIHHLLSAQGDDEMLHVTSEGASGNRNILVRPCGILMAMRRISMLVAFLEDVLFEAYEITCYLTVIVACQISRAVHDSTHGAVQCVRRFRLQ